MKEAFVRMLILDINFNMSARYLCIYIHMLVYTFTKTVKVHTSI